MKTIKFHGVELPESIYIDGKKHRLIITFHTGKPTPQYIYENPENKYKSLHNLLFPNEKTLRKTLIGLRNYLISKNYFNPEQ